MRRIADELSGIDDTAADTSEGRGGMTVIFLDGEDIETKLDDVKTVDDVTTLHDDADEPVAVRSDHSARAFEIASTVTRASVC